MKRLIREVTIITQNAKKLLIITLSFALFGVLVWCTTDGIAYLWRTSVKPPFCVPLPLLFVFWVAAYLLYGVMLSANLYVNVDESALKLTLSYLISLFWCPLALSAASKVAAVASLVISLVYLLIFIKNRRSFSLITCISAAYIFLVQLYSAYITVGIC